MLFLALFLTFIPAHAAEVSGDIVGHLDGSRKYCQSPVDTAYAATAYTLADPKLSLDGDKLGVEAQFFFLRCVNKDDRYQWIYRDINESVSYEVTNGQGVRRVESYYTAPEILFTARESAPKPYAILDQFSLLGGSDSEAVNVSARLDQILSAESQRELERDGSTNFFVDIFLRTTNFYSIDGGERQPLGLRAWGGFTVRGRIVRDADGKLTAILR